MILFILFLLALAAIVIIHFSSYTKPIAALVIDDSLDITLISVKPTKRYFKSLSCGRASSFVSLGNGYYAYYYEQDPDRCFMQFNQISFSSNVYVFKRRLGRFQSIDLSDRCLSDVLNKFQGVI